jgi:hypothetical protein
MNFDTSLRFFSDEVIIHDVLVTDHGLNLTLKASSTKQTVVSTLFPRHTVDQ